MPPFDDPFWLALLLKMSASALLVVTASLVVERSGPLAGALIATLPLSAGPNYAYLALDHGPVFLAGSGAYRHAGEYRQCLFRAGLRGCGAGASIGPCSPCGFRRMGRSSIRGAHDRSRFRHHDRSEFHRLHRRLSRHSSQKSAMSAHHRRHARPSICRCAQGP